MLRIICPDLQRELELLVELIVELHDGVVAYVYYSLLIVIIEAIVIVDSNHNS